MTISAGRLTTIPSSLQRQVASPVTSPITAQSSFHLSAMELISPGLPPSDEEILSWVSERAISQGSIFSLRGTRSTLTGIPAPLLEAISLEDETIPAPHVLHGDYQALRGSQAAFIGPFRRIPTGTREGLGAAPVNSEEAKAAPATLLPGHEPIARPVSRFCRSELTIPPSGTSPGTLR